MRKKRSVLIEELHQELFINFSTYAVRAVLWRRLYEKRSIPFEYRARLVRFNLINRNGQLTASGKCLAKRHAESFKALAKQTKNLTDDQRKAISERMSKKK